VVCSVGELGERVSEAKLVAWARPGQRSRRIADKGMKICITELILHSFGMKSTDLFTSQQYGDSLDETKE